MAHILILIISDASMDGAILLVFKIKIHMLQSFDFCLIGRLQRTILIAFEKIAPNISVCDDQVVR